MTDLARFMFDRQADSYEADPAMRELAWADASIRQFWDDEAQAIRGFLEPSWIEGWLAAMDWLGEYKGFEGIALAEEMRTRLPEGLLG